MAAQPSIFDALGGTTGVVGAGLSLIPTVAKIFTGAAQRRRANRINPVDPGFQMNTGIIDNKRQVDDMYNNYTLPGKSAILNSLQATAANSIDTATQGATSSGDVLDAATKIGYGEGQNINALGIQEAQSKQALLPMVLDANAAAGNELVRKNQFDEQRYQAQVAEKAALLQGGATNSFSGFDDLATLGGSLLNYKAQPYTQTPGTINPLPGIFGGQTTRRRTA